MVYLDDSNMPGGSLKRPERPSLAVIVNRARKPDSTPGTFRVSRREQEFFLNRSRHNCSSGVFAQTCYYARATWKAFQRQVPVACDTCLARVASLDEKIGASPAALAAFPRFAKSRPRNAIERP